MARSDSTTTLAVDPRTPEGSRSTRRLRREGRVPGVVYGGGDEPVCFHADARELRAALAHGGAVIDLTVGDKKATPVVVKDEQHDPVKGHVVHLDLLRVRLDVKIQATTILDLVGVDDAPGVKEGGVLDQVTREVNIEALPTNIPDAIQHDVSAMEINDTIMLTAVTVPDDVVFLDDLEETVVATLSPPRLEVEEPEIEEETELVGEEGDGAPEGEGDEREGGEESGEGSRGEDAGE